MITSVKMRSILGVLSIFSFLVCIQAAKYPRMNRACYRNMPESDLNECLKNNFQESLPRFRSGIPGIYTGSIDPLYWPKFSHFFGGDLIQGSLTVKELNVWGFSNTKVQAIRAKVKNPQKMFVQMDWRVPRMNFFGHFKINARLGSATFQGAGPFSLNLTGVGGTWKVTGSREKGEPIMEIISFKGAPRIETFKVWAKGVALGNEQLSDLVVSTINRGWRIFHEIANPAVEKQWGNWCKDQLNRVFLTVPYDELFPAEKPINATSSFFDPVSPLL